MAVMCGTESRYFLQEATVSSCNSRPEKSGRVGHDQGRCLAEQGGTTAAHGF